MLCLEKECWMQPEELLQGLTEPQRAAVLHADGPLLVLAGAGSGKTRVITRRAAYLASTVTRPCHVLAITFTNKAATEMRQRVAALGLPGMTVATFHSLCARLLRVYAGQVGLKGNFSIYDEADRNEIVRKAIAACELGIDQWPVNRVIGAISLAKNHMLTPAGYAQREVHDFGARTIARIWDRYDALMRERNAVDFDDLLLLMARMLKDKADVRNDLADTYRYVLIDEYQDTNLAQFEIARLLCEKYKNICATGDPDQSIYGWRGATISNILEFEQHYPNARVVKLEQNYRSTPKILAVASKLIASNTQRKEKRLWTQNGDGPPVRVVECEDADSEAEYVARQIKELADQGRALKDIAVFCRINALTRVLETAMRNNGLAYQIAKGTEFYSRKEIKDTVSYLRVLANPDDEVSLTRVINTPSRGIGDTSIERLQEYAQTHNLRLMDAMRQADRIETLTRGAGPKVKQFAQMLDELQGHMDKPVHELIDKVIKRTGLEKEFELTSTEDNDRVANVGELISSAVKFEEESDEPNLVNFLAQVSLVSDQDAIKGESGTVTLMTLHAAKGLEFPVVFMVGLEEGVLPHARAKDDPNQMEEERRLCFVGITRAMHQLTISRARRRQIRGAWLPTVRSPFLMEMPLDQIEWHSEAEGVFRAGRPNFRSNGGSSIPSSGRWEDRRSRSSWDRDDDPDSQGPRFDSRNEDLETGRNWEKARRTKTPYPGASGSSTAAGGGSAFGIKVGQMVTHGKYGVGKVASVEGSGDDAKASVEFKTAGKRTFFLKFGTIRPAR
jgi:DNA helicase-2/ATP-dependent DNA helicase PcrA